MNLFRIYHVFQSSNQVEKQSDCTMDEDSEQFAFANKVTNTSNKMPRIRFTGDYHKYECTIQVEKITTEDEGTWKCEVESYVFGPFRGTVKTRTISINVFQSQSKSESKSKLFKKLQKDLRESIK